jgi:RNA polymerase sigma-70 factor, ECF subfamily
MTVPPISFDQLVQRHRRELLAYLIRMLGNVHDAEDVCQDVLIRAYRSFDHVILNSNARAWLYRIATNSALNALNRRRRVAARQVSLAALERMPAPVHDFDHRERLRRVAVAVGQLPPRQRAALMQRRFQDLSYEEIAVSLNCNPTTARAHVYQAIKKLRQAASQ